MLVGKGNKAVEIGEKTSESGFTINRGGNRLSEVFQHREKEASLPSFSSSDVKEMLGCWRLR